VQPCAAKASRFLSVGFDSDEFALGRAIPIVSTTGVKESARQAAERQNQFAGIIALESVAREFEK